jgi:hypothetical protein
MVRSRDPKDLLDLRSDADHVEVAWLIAKAGLMCIRVNDKAT